MIVEKIDRLLSSSGKSLDGLIIEQFGRACLNSFDRQFIKAREESTNIGMSSFGKCPRALAYKFHGFKEEGKEIDTRGKMTFFFGDIIEASLVALANFAGCGIDNTGTNQIEIEKTICGVKVTGHPDGTIGDDTLFECKSMNDMAYKRLEAGELEDSYIAQTNVYMGELGLKKCVLLAMNKNTSVLGEMIIKFDKKIYDDTIESVSKVFRSTKDALPEPRYTALSTGFYPWNCLYCAHWKTCKPNAKKVLVGKAYRLKETKCSTETAGSAPATTDTKE